MNNNSKLKQRFTLFFIILITLNCIKNFIFNSIDIQFKIDNRKAQFNYVSINTMRPDYKLQSTKVSSINIGRSPDL